LEFSGWQLPIYIAKAREETIAIVLGIVAFFGTYPAIEMISIRKYLAFFRRLVRVFLSAIFQIKRRIITDFIFVEVDSGSIVTVVRVHEQCQISK